MELWQFSPPQSFVQGMVTTKRYENGAMVANLSLAKRKDMAMTLNLKGKDNKSALDVALLGLTDRIKEAGIAEFAKMAASQDWTGKRFAIRQGKNGQKTATMVLQSVKRSSEVTVDQMSAALMKMTPEQRAATLARLATAGAQGGGTVDVPPNPEPEPEPQPDTGSAPSAEELARIAGEAAALAEAHIAELRAKGLTDEEIASELELEREIAAEEAHQTAGAVK